MSIVQELSPFSKGTAMQAAYAILQQAVMIQDSITAALQHREAFYDNLVARGLVIPFIRSGQPTTNPA